MVWLYVAAGGAAGAVARYGLAGWVHARAGVQLPWGTLVVNVLGSLLVGVAVRYLEVAAHTPELRALLTIGLLGGFTTFSTFSHETVALIQEGSVMRAGIYALGSLALGLAAVWTGMAGAGLVLPARG